MVIFEHLLSQPPSVSWGMASTLPPPQPNAAESSPVNLALTDWWCKRKLFGFQFLKVHKRFNKRVRQTACSSQNKARIVKNADDKSLY